MITASLVIHNTPFKLVRPLIEEIQKSDIKRLFIIDNSDKRGALSLVNNNDKIEYYHVENRGFGNGHNFALNKSIEIGSDYHIVFNPDISFDKNVINSLKEYMDNNRDVGLVMPKILYPDGELQYLCKLLPTPFDLILRRFFPQNFCIKQRNRYELRNSGYNEIMEVPSLSGCFMFLRTEALKNIGGFDERFFLYGEDIDLSRRIHQQYKTIYYPYVSVYHRHEKASYKSTKMLLIHIRSLIKYFNKWGWFHDEERKKINKKTLRQFSHK